MVFGSELGFGLTGALLLLTGGCCAWLYFLNKRHIGELTQQFDTVVQASSDAITLEDANGNVTCWNAGAQAMFGYTAAEMLSQKMGLLTPFNLQQEEADALKLASPFSFNTVRLSKNGKTIAVALTLSPLFDAKGIRIGTSRVMRNIQQQVIAAEVIRLSSFNDTLTGLPNWRLLRDRLWRAQLNSGRQKSFFAVLYVDLDSFKTINDNYGYEAGDALLVEVSARLMAAVRQIDTVARLGGDEFLVLLEELGSQEAYALSHANGVADKILDLLEQRDYLLSNTGNAEHEVRVNCTASIGIQVLQGGNGNVDQIIKNADIAMARVKEGRKMVVRGMYTGKV